MFFRRQAVKPIMFAERLQSLRASGFAVEAQADGSVRVERSGCAALIGPERIAQAGWVVAGQIGALVDAGYQKFWQAGERRVPALAAQLDALHEFEEDLKEALGMESEYNTSLGTTNDRHEYDRPGGRIA